MSYPALLWGNPATIGWIVRDANDLPVVGATVTATLYSGRDADDPVTTPGTAVNAMTNMNLADQGDGLYSVDVPASSIPAVGSNYVLVIEARMTGALIRHWEERTEIVSEANVIELCRLESVKDYLGISLSDTSQDKVLRRWIRSCSRDFIGRIRRPNLLLTADYSELVRVMNWQTEERLKDIFVSNWPINWVTSVTINDTVLPEYDPDKPDVLGWTFDAAMPSENRQYITLRGLYWPIFETWLSPRRPIYRPSPMRVYIGYNAGYSDVPEDIEEAIIEWVAYKKGLRELQMHDQTEQWVQLGQYQQNNMIATSTLKMSELDLPASVASVIEVYQRPVSP